jgi:hypothetical protein
MGWPVMAAISDFDTRRLQAWVNLRDDGKWECPDCGSNLSHYMGGHYCSGCHSPIVCICLPSKNKNGKSVKVSL